MAYMRGQERMVYQTMFDTLKAGLTDLDWLQTTVADLPYGASSPITLVEQLPEGTTSVTPNTVAFTDGTVGDDEDGELGANGGGLWIVEHTFFVDVLGESRNITKAITADVRAILLGRLPDTNRHILMKDYVQHPAVDTDHILYVEEIVNDRPVNQQYKQIDWAVVRMTVSHSFTGVTYG